MSPVVSIIIPAYNTADYIGQAIASALHQTLTDIEIIVVDDCSTDRTLAVVREFSDPRLIVLTNECNLGVSASRNRALAIAQGTWIAVLDSDDWDAPERLATLVAIAEANHADLIADDLHLVQSCEEHPWSSLLRESGEDIPEPKWIDPVYCVETGLYGKRGLHLGVAKPLFRRDFLTRHGIQYNESLRRVEDFHLLLNALIQGAKFLFVPTPYYFYQARPGSLVTQSKVNHIAQFSDAIQSCLRQEQVHQNPTLVSSLSKSLSVLNRYYAYYCVVEPLKQQQFSTAIAAALQHPYFFVHLLGQLRTIINRRIQYYFFKNKFVYETMRGDR